MTRWPEKPANSVTVPVHASSQPECGHMYRKLFCIFLFLFSAPLAANAAPTENPATFSFVPRHFKGSETKFRQWLQSQNTDVPLGLETVLVEANGSLFAVWVPNGSGIIGADLYLFSCVRDRCDQLLFVERIVRRAHGRQGKLIINFSKDKKEIVVKEDDGFIHASRKFRQ